ncbi:hypothetical protein P872_01350 [Rhodonellum psychrophilum GCM71 = DSM 17998]|uniref:dTTP/UTP pyrophosphatase n=2 Tax=Rhodonellum TaxID=336827 RepID=U5C2B4_9BACT|nr:MULTISPECIES: Maf family protein [Rhodonellum]ERM83934.1 hypothetical protein P872_01350 [Rhodonellum psychrophilum GCM71 = DSM 17998]SDZ05139.1 septum formation protein [Rhodonellum ikkaensis]
MIPLIDKKIILASKSPRRSELLRGLGLEFEIKTKDTEEDFPSEMPVGEVAGFLSEKKAMAFAEELQEGELVIAADTIVVLGNQILGKPTDAKGAFEMLTALSNRTHEVITGVTLMDKERILTFQDIAKVYFKPITELEIQYYIEKYKPFDKAGAYGIQEWIGFVAVDKIEGSYYTVMGLPVHRVYKELSLWGQ